MVYVDFTARWCATCQANKKLVFGSSDVLRTFDEKKIVTLRADWTNQDPRITAELAKYTWRLTPSSRHPSPFARAVRRWWALGILDRFADFLTILGVALPPIAGIMVAEYFLVRRWRPALDESREHGRLPATEPGWVPATLVIWVGAAVLGYWTEQVQFGIPALNSLVVAGVVYLIAGKAGLVRGTKELAVEKGAA